MNVLFINACVRPQSRTHLLTDRILQKLGGQVTEINLEKEHIQPLTNALLEKRTQLLTEQKYDDDFFRYARQFAQADIIVIGAPYWDLSFPAMLKCFVETISVNGITFEYTVQGPRGLCRAKKLIYATTSGGYIPEDNFGYDYFKALAKTLYGIPETQYFKAEGLDIIGMNVNKILEQSLLEIDEAL